MGKKKDHSNKHHHQQASSSLKTSKKDHSNHHHQEQQFNSLIKILKPKVYITDPSSFKKLVQDLTGKNNNNVITTSSPSSSSLTSSPSLEPTSSSSGLCNNNYDDEYYYSQSMMMNNNNSVELEQDQWFDQFCKSGLQELDDAVLGDYYVNTSTTSVAYEYCDQINYVESLLFDEQLVEEEEPNPFYTQVEQDISIYDYDF